MNRKIYLSLLGDINNPLEWSGTGYYCLENLKKISNNIQGISLKTDSLKYKLQRINWNLYQRLLKKSSGGFQYSEVSLNSLWKKQEKKLKQSIIINFFPLFPKDINNDKSISKYFYIDFTINQLFRLLMGREQQSDEANAHDEEDEDEDEDYEDDWEDEDDDGGLYQPTFNGPIH